MRYIWLFLCCIVKNVELSHFAGLPFSEKSFTPPKSYQCEHQIRTKTLRIVASYNISKQLYIVRRTVFRIFGG
jgi:hypothetical protein